MMSLQRAADLLHRTCKGDNAEFSSVSTDTRKIKSGDLYIALQGKNFDGHDYINQAQQAGAIAAIVHKDVTSNLPMIKVDNTRKALGRLAAGWRQTFGGEVIGITGSNGKTTVKEMLAAILAKQGDVLATRGNFNNDIGLPLTVFGMNKQDYAVIEMGANHSGEIAWLTEITQPDIALITNAGDSHLEGFGSRKGVAQAKGEIFQGLADRGSAVINRDDEYSEYWQSLCDAQNVYTFSMCDKTADVYGECQQKESGIALRVFISAEVFEVNLKVHGKHNAMNALAAICVAQVLGIAHKKITTALGEFSPVKGRLNMHRVSGQLCVIDDTYNANPASLQAGINVLNELAGEHWLVMGDMGELGDDEQALHFSAGLTARELGVDRLLATGRASRQAVEAFGENAIFFETKDELVAYIKQNQTQVLGILVKGSRFMQMEHIVESLIERFN
ncbi:UDP-N-acetylmuramoyl-tripeptide--D-alanyl-D-alanine ligase [hydrothermal vent metagenome]|uniref:UDP-MurNAc-pentapeptide synthetase n=1 Tax=hydrothermal vent metagenome TaxID=652676 RepID=A0A3B0X7D3_9ZZZZ